MATDLTEFKELSRRIGKKQRCRIGEAIGQLNDEQRTQLDAALAEDSLVISPGAIVAWLAARDIASSNSAVLSHRRETCSCAHR